MKLEKGQTVWIRATVVDSIPDNDGDIKLITPSGNKIWVKPHAIITTDPSQPLDPRAEVVARMAMEYQLDEWRQGRRSDYDRAVECALDLLQLAETKVKEGER